MCYLNHNPFETTKTWTYTAWGNSILGRPKMKFLLPPLFNWVCPKMAKQAKQTKTTLCNIYLSILDRYNTSIKSHSKAETRLQLLCLTSILKFGSIKIALFSQRLTTKINVTNLPLNIKQASSILFWYCHKILFCKKGFLHLIKSLKTIWENHKNSKN